MDVWLHVGAGKTGTSAFQVALSQNREALAGAGLYYPVGIDDEETALAGGVTSGNAKQLGWLISPSERKPGFNSADVLRWLDAALAEAGQRTALFSSEMMQVPDRDALAELVKRIRSTGRRVRILYLVRHALDHAVSAYAQGLKTARIPLQATCLEDFLKRHKTVFLRRLENFESVVGRDNVACRLYDAERLGKGLAHNLLSQIRPEFASALSPATSTALVNRSPTGLELQVLEKIARLPENATRLAWLTTRGLFRAPAAVPSEISVSREAFLAFSDRNRDTISEVNSRYFGGEQVLKLSSGRIGIGEVESELPASVFETAAAMVAGAVSESESRRQHLLMQIKELKARIRTLQGNRPGSQRSSAAGQHASEMAELAHAAGTT